MATWTSNAAMCMCVWTDDGDGDGDNDDEDEDDDACDDGDDDDDVDVCADLTELGSDDVAGAVQSVNHALELEPTNIPALMSLARYSLYPSQYCQDRA
eukprot:1778403-Rhodomonas_salina.2